MRAQNMPEESDFARQLTRRLDHLVSLLREFSVRPALGLSKGLLLGALASIVGLAIAVLAVIGLSRLFNEDVFHGRVWATDFLFGGMFLLLGAFLIRLGVRRKDVSHG